MIAHVPQLLRSRLKPAAFAKLAVVLVVTAVGAGIWMSAWAHWIATPSYVPSDGLAELFAGYLRGDRAAVRLIVLQAPFTEELLVRGFLLSVLLCFYRPWIAITVSALLFGVGHLNLVQLLPGVLMGLVLGILYYHTASLTLCFLGHAVYNAQFWVAREVLPHVPAGYSPLPPAGSIGDLPSSVLASGAVLLVGGLYALTRSLQALPTSARPQCRREATQECGQFEKTERVVAC